MQLEDQVHDSRSRPEGRTGEPSNAAKQSQTFVFRFRRRVFRMGLELDVGGVCGPGSAAACCNASQSLTVPLNCAPVSRELLG